MVKRLRYIATILALMLLCGASTQAWADVTYHILTKPITTQKRPMSGESNINVDVNAALVSQQTNVRVEAFRCTSKTLTVGLPDEYKSPLAKNFKYYTSTRIKKSSTTEQLYGYNDTKYHLYWIKTSDNDEDLSTDNADYADSQVAAGTAIADNTDIYVTYEYDENNTICDLTGTKIYNIQLGNNRMLCLNKGRNNRPGGMQLSKLADHLDYLSSDDFCYIQNGVNSGNHEYFFIFKFKGSDPYNIRIEVAYEKGSTFQETDKNLNKKVYKEYRGSQIFSKFDQGGSSGNNMWLSSDVDTQWQASGADGNADAVYVPGYFRGTDNNRKIRSEMSPIFNSFAILNHYDGTHLALAGSKLNVNGNNWQPNGSGQSGYLYANNDNDIRMGYKNRQNVDAVTLWEVRTYTLNVTTPFYTSGDDHKLTTTMRWSDYAGSANLVSKVPDAMRRKYTTITGTYKEVELTNSITTFADAVAADNGNNVWLKYTVNTMPFETLPIDGTYANARWYTMRMNGDKEDINIVKYDNSTSKFITGGGSNSDIHYGENSAEAMVAFIGDPYELRIVNRKTSETASANSYIGCASDATDGTDFGATTSTSAKIGWEIVDDDVTGTFILREFGTATAATPMYFGWHYGATNNPIYYKDAGNRIKVVALDKKDYVYHIINSAGNVAVKMTEAQDIGTPLRLSSIPELIRSPFLALLSSANIKYYWKKSDAESDTNAKTHASYDPETDSDSDGNKDYHIYVKYTGMATALATSRVHFHTDQSFNVVLNGQYLYYSGGNINSKYPITNDEADDDEYLWRLEGQDPYDMKVYNAGAYAANNSKAYINTTFEDEAALTFDASATAASFVALSGTVENSFEVMAATGETLDIATNYYHIGRKTNNTVKMYDSKEVHGYASIRFQLTKADANVVYYHLIDKEHTDLLQIRSRYELVYFPSDYRSPLVAQYHYYPTKDDAEAGTNELAANASIATLISGSTIADRDADGYPDIYVTYDTGDDYDLQNKRTMYLLKYDMGDSFRQEDGADGLTADPVQAVYPYCNGDGNFFVYGQEQYDYQQEGAASTRTRWAWFLESINNDPYHVKICSRQIETYNGYDTRAYFCTYAETYGGTKHVVTSLSWPGISGIPGTDYMMLGAVGQFRLVTSSTIAVDLNDDGDTDDANESNDRHVVNSFEQYWKTWNTIRLKVLGDADAVARQSDPNAVPETPVAPVAEAAGKNNKTYLTDEMGWHCYAQWAYAVRWNGYNRAGDKGKKGWESLEHWFQTVNMGEGYFDLIPTTIDPVLILLDQHGWEIMRKPLPESPSDPYKEDKYNAIRPYDSPMVKEYHFWTKASKRSGYHQYYSLSQQIKVDGANYSSTSLTDLPPFDATNVHDAKGNLYDQYVTYVVKDEYVQGLGEPFLIQQGSHFASATNATTLKNDNTVPATGGMSQYIIDNAGQFDVSTGSKRNELWTLKPNPNIDQEMGYDVAGNPAHDWTNDYTVTNFSASGFDPYNIQIANVQYTAGYFLTNSTGATLEDGGWAGTYSETPGVTLGAAADPRKSATWYDSRTMAITNITFMAVQDDEGHMQLMPRFDHSRRLKDFSSLVAPNAANIEQTYTTLYRPHVYDYRIIDNDGNEALRYQGGGDLVPQTPEWFKSQLAKDFVYGASLTERVVTDTIKGSLMGATLTDNTVYVHYSYDEDADVNKVLQGKWLTMTLNAKDAVYNSGLKQASASKPTPVNASHKDWQWKFLATPQSTPDPYAVSLYNRNVGGAATTVNSQTKFALLNYYDNDGVDPSKYTLAVAGTRLYTYDFVNGNGMTTSVDATTATETNVKSTSCSYDGTKAQVILTDDVEHTFTYKIYTNDDAVSPAHDGKYGVFAVQAEQDNATVVDNGYVPTLPYEIRSPLLNENQFIYYGAEADMGDSEKELSRLYGPYDDIVYVRYTAYDDKTTDYKVPNVKAVVDSKVARGANSNDAALDLSGALIYNIIWYDDNMMKRGDADAISSDASHALSGDAAYIWQFEGDDPYAIKIKHKGATKYAVGTGSLAESATSTFMLLPSNEWQYGVLAKTGASRYQLSGYGNTLADTEAATPETPTRFIIFGLSINKVIYHLVIANIDNTVNIPYRETKGGLETTKAISGSTCRDLTSCTTVAGDTYQLGETINGLTYCVDGGNITLGDSLIVPDALARPNCKYFFYVEGVYTNEDCSRAIAYGTSGSHIAELDGQYRGLQITRMGKEPELLGTTVRINIEYQFDDGLPTNTGSHFVTNTTGTQWYTFETSDETPYLAHYTYKDAKLTGVEGRVGHHTNDFLWSPVGDPYGFKMYNRYVYKNGGETTKVMTTESAPANNADLVMVAETSTDYEVYELLAGATDGNFKVQTLTVPGTGTPFYLDNNAGTLKLKTSTTTEWHFGLDEVLFTPYYEGAGNVGGLNAAGKIAYEAAGDLITKQTIVYNDDNIVQFTPGYYRIFNQPNSQGITVPRYLSGYTHKTELTGDGSQTNAAIPMHFYERTGVTTSFDVLGSGFTKSAPTQGQIPIVAPEYDPASIFYITSAGGSAPYTMQTQGLYVKENKMTATAGEATSFYVTDIGGAVVLLYTAGTGTPEDIATRNYLNYNQASNIYDVKYSQTGIADAAKWCMEPANKKGLWIETHSGGEEEVLTDLWYYSSYCVPFDMLIQRKGENAGDGVGIHSSNAYTCVAEWNDEPESPWTTTMLHPRPIGKYNAAPYQNDDYFVPAGTPVLFSTKRATQYIKATIPTTTPSTPIETIFSYEYLEQIISDTYDNDRRVYVFGPKMEGEFTLNTSTGAITAALPSTGNTNVGFHINANLNKESGMTTASWTRHNYYVLHNKIYYRAPSGGGGAPERDVQYVPVIFDDEDAEKDDEQPKDEGAEGSKKRVGDGCVYDVLGRKVASQEQVKDGTWYYRLQPGIYIINGKKICVGVGTM